MKNIQPVSIPIQAKLSLAEVDDTIHSLQEPAFAEKNSIAYQGLVRNAHVNEGFGYLTTNGRKITKEQLLDGDRNIGTRLIDDTGKYYDIPHNWLLRRALQLKNISGGTIVSATIYNNSIYELYEDQDAYTVLVTDNNSEIIGLKQLDCLAATFGSTFDTDNAPTLWQLKSSVENKEKKSWTNTITEVCLSDIETIKTHTVDYEAPLGLKMTATDLGTKKLVGFEDIDQEKRGHLVVEAASESFKPYFGTVAPNGVVTGEPIPYLQTSDGTRLHFKKGTDTKVDTLVRAENGVLMWNVKKVINTASVPSDKNIDMALLVGYLPNGEPATTKYWKCDNNSTTQKYWITANISTNDTIPADTFPAEDPRMKPKEWFISNYADSKGVYYEWGQGWAKTYYRSCYTASNKIVDMGLFTLGATPGYDEENGKNWQRHESLMAQGKTKEWDYAAGQLNKRIYTLGGNNRDEASLLDAIPFTVDLLYQGTEESGDIENIDVFRSQVYGLVETSYSFLQTLLTTPSEVKDGIPMSLRWKKNKALIVFANGELYDVVHSSSADDFKIDKVADYAFRLNVLDGKNALKEDREGNLSLVRAFIPYNMECVINIKKLKLTPASTNTANTNLDANNAWYEGIGSNVNLFVDDISMSFLSPMINLPLFIDSKEVDKFKEEAIDNRHSILLPALRGCYSPGESVDVYYTLQGDSQDCTYKQTQLMLPDSEEVRKNNWQKYGKSTYNVLKRGYSWWIDATGTVIFPIGIGSAIAGINFITPSAQLPQGYSSRLYTNNNQLFLGFNYLSQIWHGATIFTIYGQNYYYDGQGIYFLGADQDFSNNNFVTYALGMKYLANSGSEAYFFSDFEKRLYVFTGSNTLQPADLLSNVEGTIEDAVFSSKEQTLYMLTSEGRILVRTQTDLCQLVGMNANGHLEGTTEGCAIVGTTINEETSMPEPSFKVFSPWKGDKVLPFALRTEHFGSPDMLFKCSYIDVVLYKVNENPKVTFTCQTLNGIEKEAEKHTIKINSADWKGSQYRYRLTPKLNNGNAFDIGIYSEDEVGVQNITFYLIPLGNGQGDAWNNNVVNEVSPVAIKIG